MRTQIEVVYENGVFRPLGSVPAQVRERQRYTVTIEGPNGGLNLQDSQPARQPRPATPSPRPVWRTYAPPLPRSRGRWPPPFMLQREER